MSEVQRLNYTRLITCVLYEGGAESMMESLYQRGIREAYFYPTRGKPIGRTSEAGDLPEIPKTERSCTRWSRPINRTISTRCFTTTFG